jgi:hypothetical protein
VRGRQLEGDCVARRLSPFAGGVQRALGVRESGLFLKKFSISGAFGPDFDGFGLLGDELRDATGGGGEEVEKGMRGAGQRWA